MQNERATRYALGREALWLMAGIPLAPTLGERKLLAQFLCGVLTIDQFLGLVEDRLQTAQAMAELKRLTAESSS